jgi:hypothetical protein
VLGTQENPEQFFPLAAALAVLENHGGENAVRGEKRHQGFFAEKRALHRGITWSNSTTALGLRSLAVENRVRSRCTGKERDSESGLDMFCARYYGSSGRFMTPDWTAKPTDVPMQSSAIPSRSTYIAISGTTRCPGWTQMATTVRPLASTPGVGTAVHSRVFRMPRTPGGQQERRGSTWLEEGTARVCSRSFHFGEATLRIGS